MVIEGIKLKEDGPFANIKYRNIPVVECNRVIGYICMPFVILCVQNSQCK